MRSSLLPRYFTNFKLKELVGAAKVFSTTYKDHTLKVDMSRAREMPLTKGVRMLSEHPTSSLSHGGGISSQVELETNE